jgi:hypothetical protein
MFYAIEQAGLTVDIPLYEQYFEQDTEGVVYTQYNFKTLTTRPSNTFNGINYAALNKENGCRKAFIARNSSLVEFDIALTILLCWLSWLTMILVMRIFIVTLQIYRNG